MSEKFKQMMAGAVEKTRPHPGPLPQERVKPEAADDKKATVRIELPALAFRSEPPQPAAWEAMCCAADTMLAVISTYHNLVVAGTVKPTDSERLRVTIALEQLSTCSHQVIRMLEKGGGQ